jgi:hypothetical protein
MNYQNSHQGEGIITSNGNNPSTRTSNIVNIFLSSKISKGGLSKRNLSISNGDYGDFLGGESSRGQSGPRLGNVWPGKALAPGGDYNPRSQQDIPPTKPVARDRRLPGYNDGLDRAQWTAKNHYQQY